MKNLIPCLAFVTLLPGCTFDPRLDRPDSGYYPCEYDGTCLLQEACFCFENLHCVPRSGSDPLDCWPGCRTHADCDDEDRCTEDVCLGGSHSCSHDPVSFPGAEGPGTCQNGVDDDCDGLTDTEDTADCGCVTDDDCEDGNECTDDRCPAGSCANYALSGNACADDGNPCTQDQCLDGICDHVAASDGDECNDGLYCTDPDACTAGACTGPQRDCADGDPGTVDACDEILGTCTHRLPGEEICFNRLDDDVDGDTDECCLGDGAFVLQGTYPASPEPSQIRAADFNEDGALDLLVTSSDSPVPPVLQYLGNLGEGRPDGTFGGPRVLLAETALNSVAVSDLDGDDILDIAGTWRDGSLVFLFGSGSDGHGDGSFEQLEQHEVCETPHPIEIADFDRDHVPDLVVGCHAMVGPDLEIHYGKRTAAENGYAIESFLPIDLPPDEDGVTPDGVLSIAVADFNADGYPDLAAAADPCVDLYLILSCQNTDCMGGPFSAPAGYPMGGRPTFVTAGDFDRNGTVDLAVSVNAEPEWNRIHVLDGVGDGTFLGGFQTGFPTLPGVLAEADFNGDAIPDLIETERDADHATVMVGQGSNGLPYGSYAWGFDVVVGEYPRWVLPADFNADGIVDLAFTRAPAGAAEGYLDIWLGTGRGGRPDGTFREGSTFHAGAGAIDLTTADFDADGIADLAVANRDDNSVTLLLGGGSEGRPDGTFVTLDPPHMTGAHPAAVAAVDLDGDHIVDLAVANQNASSVSIFGGLGTGGRGNGDFAIRTDQYLEDASPGGPIDLATADFDGDGMPDLAALVQEFDLIVLLTRYTGSFPAEPFDGEIAVPAGFRPVSILAADFNEDGRVDLATAGIQSGMDGSVNILLNRTQPGDEIPAFEPPVPIMMPGGFRGLSSGDFNGDGILDLAAANFNRGRVQVLLGTGSNGVGDGMFVPGDEYDLISSPENTLVADLDGDNALDVVATGGGMLGVLLGHGNGTFATGQIMSASSNSVGLVGGRFNADGFLDLAIVNWQDDNVTILFGEGNCLAP